MFGGSRHGCSLSRTRTNDALQGFEISNNDREQIVEIMGDAAGELTNTLHLLSLRQLFLSARQGSLGFTTLRHITSDLDKADHPTALVADHVDDHAGPKS